MSSSLSRKIVLYCNKVWIPKVKQSPSQTLSLCDRYSRTPSWQYWTNSERKEWASIVVSFNCTDKSRCRIPDEDGVILGLFWEIFLWSMINYMLWHFISTEILTRKKVTSWWTWIENSPVQHYREGKAHYLRTWTILMIVQDWLSEDLNHSHDLDLSNHS